MTGKSHKVMPLAALILTIALLHCTWLTEAANAQATIPVVTAAPLPTVAPATNGALRTETADAILDVGPLPSLTVRNTIGMVTVTRGTDDTQIVIHVTKHATTDAALQQKMFTIMRDGDTVTLADENPGGGISVRGSAELAMLPSADIAIAVPHQTNLTIRNTQGAIAISGIAGVVDAATNTGEIRLNDGTGSLTARTTVGAITIKDFLGSAQLRATNGDITVAGTFTGDMPNQLQTTRGNITFVGALAPASHTDVGTTSGNVAFSLPPQSAFALTIDTGAGNQVTVNFAVMVMTYAEQPRRMLAGVVGSPDAALAIRQTSGTITITPQM